MIRFLLALFRRQPPAPPAPTPTRATVLRLAALAAAHPRHAMPLAAAALRPGATPADLDAELARAIECARVIDRQLAKESAIAEEVEAARRQALASWAARRRAGELAP